MRGKQTLLLPLKRESAQPVLGKSSFPFPPKCPPNTQGACERSPKPCPRGRKPFPSRRQSGDTGPSNSTPTAPTERGPVLHPPSLPSTLSLPSPSSLIQEHPPPPAPPGLQQGCGHTSCEGERDQLLLSTHFCQVGFPQGPTAFRELNRCSLSTQQPSPAHAQSPLSSGLTFMG